MAREYEAHPEEIRIVPGQWRPHFPFEQIVWIRPPWPSQDYIWLDFPEAVFTDLGLLYLSHVNPAYPVRFPNLPQTPWQPVKGGLGFERALPNGVTFGGTVRTDSNKTVLLDLYIRNNGESPLRDIKLQTCAYLRGIKEFAEHTQQNKLVHTPGSGWGAFDAAKNSRSEEGKFRLGWRAGPEAADLPVMATLSSQAERLFAMTWYNHTYSLVGNPDHPCLHADPFFPDLAPGEEGRICGALFFFEGSLRAFEDWFSKERKEAS